MAKNSKETKKPAPRLKVKDLPKRKKELSDQEQKKVKGGGFIKSVDGGGITVATTGKTGGA
jgi:hypothetical protein